MLALKAKNTDANFPARWKTVRVKPDKLSCLSLNVPVWGLCPSQVYCHQANHATLAEHLQKISKITSLWTELYNIASSQTLARERPTTNSLFTWLQIFILAHDKYGRVWGPNSINICRFFTTGSKQPFGERQQEKSPSSTRFYWPVFYLFMAKTSKALCGTWHHAWKGNTASTVASQWAQIPSYLCQTCVLVKLCWS